MQREHRQVSRHDIDRRKIFTPHNDDNDVDDGRNIIDMVPPSTRGLADSQTHRHGLCTRLLDY